MKWEKLGIVFAPSSAQPDAVSHAQIPTPILLNEDIIRIYYSARDLLGRSLPYFVDVDARNPLKILNYSTGPVMDLGSPGCFDDNGIIACSVIKLPDNKFWMYYVGFELHVRVRYKLFTGLAISDDGENFKKFSNVPVLDRTDSDSCFRCGPFVRYIENAFEMFYVGGSDWTVVNGKEMPVYVIKRITSHDGINWPENGPVVIGISQDDEHGFGRPWVVPGGNDLKMFYSVRRISCNSYRMGFASSKDGLNWTRKDKDMNLEPGPDYFDDQAIMYAAVIQSHGKYYCFYNGNDFGADGFAVAIGNTLD